MGLWDIGAKVVDPGNIFGTQGNPFEGASAGMPAYQYDPSMFQLGNQYQTQYGMSGVAGTYANRQIDPTAQNMLLQAAQGNAPSAAQIMLRDQSMRNEQNTLAMMRGQPGMSPMLAARMALESNNRANAGYQVAAGAARAQEQTAARGQYAGYMQDQQKQNDQMVQYFMSLGMSADDAQMKANIVLQQLQGQAYMDYANRAWQTEMAARGYTADTQHALVGAGSGVVGGILSSNGGGGGGGGQGLASSVGGAAMAVI